jgi:hypothetical protein
LRADFFNGIGQKRKYLATYATARSNDLLGTACLGVVATNNPFNLTGGTAPVINKNDLALAHCAHRGLLLQSCGRC